MLVFSYDLPDWERFFCLFRGTPKTFYPGFLSSFMETSGRATRGVSTTRGSGWVRCNYYVGVAENAAHQPATAGGTDKALDSLPFVNQFAIEVLQNKERLFPFTATRNQTFAIVEILDIWQRASRRAKVS